MTKRGSQLRRIRTERGVTVEALANTVGVHEMTIYKWQAGTRQPTLAMARKIARALDCSIDDLFPTSEEKTA